MGIVIGIDVGISTTKIVGINKDGIVISPLRIKATDPVTSLMVPLANICTTIKFLWKM